MVEIECSAEGLNKIGVTPGEILGVLREVELRYKRGEEAVDALNVSIALYPPEKAVAVFYRISSLVHDVFAQGEPTGWTATAENEGVTFITAHTANLKVKVELIEAAAVVPFIDRDSDDVNPNPVGFDRETLLAKALELAESKGTH
jgi:hypothetical protein